MQRNGGLVQAEVVRQTSEQGHITQQYNNAEAANGGLVYAGDLYSTANQAPSNSLTVDLGSKYNHLSNVFITDGTQGNITIGSGNDT